MDVIDQLEHLSKKLGTLYDSSHIPGEVGDSDIEFICFSGGGVAGVCFLGVLRELERRGIREKIKYWLGSSAGAIAAALAALGATSEYLEKELKETDLRMFLDYGGRTGQSKHWWDKFQDYRYGISELISRWGAVRGDRFEEWVKEQFTKLGWDAGITFNDLYSQTGNHLIITGTSLNTFETLYFSRSSYPYMKILDAVRISMSIPFMFQPLVMKDSVVPQGKRILVDGGILDNFPLNACDIISDSGEILGFNRKAVGFTLIHNGKWVPDFVDITNLMRYSLTFIQAMHKRIQIIQSHQPFFWDRVAPIETAGVVGTDFGVEKEKLLGLIKSGEEATRKYLDQRAEMLQKFGPLPRNLFIPSHRLQHSGFQCLSDDLIESTKIYQTNPSKFRIGKIHREAFGEPEPEED